AAASYLSATATQGQCSEQSGVVSCSFGSVAGNAGMVTANVELSAAESGTIRSVANVSRAVPALTASTTTTIVENNPPVSRNGSLTVTENEPADGTLEATDPDGDALTFSIVTGPSHGSVVLEDNSTGAYRYTPDQDYS